MTIDLTYFNRLDQDSLQSVLFGCCGSGAWAAAVASAAPFKDLLHLRTAVDEAFSAMSKDAWLEAFTHHPMIGDVKSIKEKFATTAHFAANEQAGVENAGDELFSDLATYNVKYRDKFGFIFIICASGKSAAFMLDALKKRFNNDLGTEIKIAADEQKKITWLRLEKVGNP